MLQQRQGSKVYKEIILPLDGSELAEVAIPHALDAAKCHGARLTVLSVLEPFRVYPSQVDAYSGMWVSAELEKAEEEEWKSELEQRKAYLHEVAEKAHAEGLDVREAILEGDAASAICDYARDSRADLIVMSTHGRSGLKRWVYGSVAEKVLRGANVPVLLVRAYEGA